MLLMATTLRTVVDDDVERTALSKENSIPLPFELLKTILLFVLIVNLFVHSIDTASGSV